MINGRLESNVINAIYDDTCLERGNPSVGLLHYFFNSNKMYKVSLELLGEVNAGETVTLIPNHIYVAM